MCCNTQNLGNNSNTESIVKNQPLLPDVIVKAFMKAKWPKNIDNSKEKEFNKKFLQKFLKNLFSVFSDYSLVYPSEVQKESNEKKSNTSQSPTSSMNTIAQKLSEKKSDILFFGYNGRPDDAYCKLCINEEPLIDFLVECKVIRNGNRYDIQNSLSQSVGYLSNYKVDFLVLLIFDTCEGSKKKEINKNWDITTPECRFIHTITKEYGNLCVVRIREKKTPSNSQKNTSENINKQKSETLNNSESNAQNNENNNLPQNEEPQLVPSIVEIFYHNDYFYRENNCEC